MGHASKLLVPRGTSVIIPEYQDPNGRDECQLYKICQCGHKGSTISHCRQMPHCVHKKHCIISTGNVKGKKDYNKCNKISYTNISDEMAYANSVNLDQTAPEEAVWSGFTLFVIPQSILKKQLHKKQNLGQKVMEKVFEILGTLNLYKQTP